MAYSVLSKEGRYGNIIHFLADTNEDFAFIVDTCDPGSTIEVLSDPADEKKPNTYMKAPSGKWVHVEGEGTGELPANDAEVAVPDGEYIPQGSGISVKDMQSNIEVYPSGLVTGTSHQVTGNKLFGVKERDGHFVTILMPVPEEAKKMDIEGGTMASKKENQTPDGFLMVRLDEMHKQNKNTMTVTYKTEDSGLVVSSFKFNFSKVELD